VEKKEEGILKQILCPERKRKSQRPNGKKKRTIQKENDILSEKNTEVWKRAARTDL